MLPKYSPARHDPLRSSGGLHEANRFQRGIAEFLRLPLVITAAFSVLAVGVSLLDRLTPDAAVRTVVRSVVSEDGAVDFLSAVATSLLTVTSITFSVLLLAVQQTASSLTPVVFDQFLRRRSNQVYFGFFVGATAFSFVVLGLARQEPAPLYSATLTLVLVVASLVVLLMLIHSTIDQMRPESVVRSIHELALRAREVELKMLGRTRMARRSEPDRPEREIHVMDSGFVVTVDTEKLGVIAASAGDDVEVIVEGRLGEYMVFDDLLVRLVNVDPEDTSYDDGVIAAFGIDDIRDVNVESGYAVDQLENIAWETGTSASQSPQTASTAIRTLSDLLGRWLNAGERDRSERSTARDSLPVVYTDGAVERGLTALSTLLVGSSESRQAQTTAKILLSFARLLPRLQDVDRAAFDDALDAALPAVIQQAEIPPLRDALAELERVMNRHGHDNERVRMVRNLLSEATEQLMPKPSDEPEAAHPRR